MTERIAAALLFAATVITLIVALAFSPSAPRTVQPQPTAVVATPIDDPSTAAALFFFILTSSN